MAHLLDEGFESNSFALWNGTSNTGGTAAIINTDFFEGAYCAKFTVPGTTLPWEAGRIWKKFTAPGNSMYLRAYVKVVGNRTNTVWIYTLVDAAGTRLVQVGIDPTGLWVLRTYDGTTWTSKNSTVTAAPGGWHCVEIYMNRATGGGGTLYIDGTQVATITANLPPSSPDVDAYVGVESTYNALSAAEVHVDDVVVAQEYVGPVSAPPSPGTPLTPFEDKLDNTTTPFTGWDTSYPTVGGLAAIDKTAPYSGAACAHFTTNGSADTVNPNWQRGGALRNLGTHISDVDVWARCYVKIAAYGSGTAFLTLTDADAAATTSRFMQAGVVGGKWIVRIYNGSTYVTVTASTGPVIGNWHLAELHMHRAAGSAGYAELFIDNNYTTPVARVSGYDLTPLNGYFSVIISAETVYYGNVGTPESVYIDSIAVSNAKIGPESAPPPPTQPGSVTFNSVPEINTAIYVDDVLAGTTPCTLQLTSGTHTVRGEPTVVK